MASIGPPGQAREALSASPTPELGEPPLPSEPGPPEPFADLRTPGRFEAVQNRAVRWVLRVLPWLMFVTAAGALVVTGRPYKDGIVMFSSGIATAGVSLLLFQEFLRRVPVTLLTLWRRSTVAPGASADGPLGASYQAFCRDLERALNHWYQWLSGMGFGLLVLTWYRVPTSISIDALIFLIEVLAAFLIGLMAWRMLVIGVYIWRLGKRFDLVVKVGHPDQCGGLEPVGNLCLWNALIVCTAGIYLGAWIIVGPSTPYKAIALYYTQLYEELLVVPILVAAVSFLLPLWTVHRIMCARYEATRRELEELADSISGLTDELLKRADELEPDLAEKKSKRLELLRKTYEQTRATPTWPINVSIWSKFLVAQAVPVLGLTGLGEPLVKVIGSLMASLSQAGSQ